MVVGSEFQICSKGTTNRRPNRMEMFQRCNIQTAEKKAQLTKKTNGVEMFQRCNI
jgi:hypothetical protein